MKLTNALSMLIAGYSITATTACQFKDRKLTDEEIHKYHPGLSKQKINQMTSGMQKRNLRRHDGGHTGGDGGGGGGGWGGGHDGGSDSNKLPPLDQFPTEFRTIDGTQNNKMNPLWGSAESTYIRKTTPEYGSDNSPSGQDRPNPRLISNSVLDQVELKFNSKGASDYLWQWGQFLDHDVAETATLSSEPFEIDVPTCDIHFDPMCHGNATMSINRSAYHNSNDGVRQQINAITAYIDASNVYGSDEERSFALRTLSGGKLKTGEHNLLPKNDDGLPNAGGPNPSFFLAGDVRSNEQVGLISIHTLFVREHNFWADRIAKTYGIKNDEKIYQLARVIVAAEMQAITYNEFLPLLLGSFALSPYGGYKSSVNAGISNVFAVAAYRVGHTMLNDRIMTPGISPGFLDLKDAFFNIGLVDSHNIDSFLRGLSQQRAQDIDCSVADSVRNFLFGNPGDGGHDLASLNIMRGRDHGMPSYNSVRASYGLPRISSFDDFGGNEDGIVDSLKAAYNNNIELLDVYVGMLAESHVSDAMVGETFKRVLSDQFERLRDGDRFWYEHYLSNDLRRLVKDQTLSRIIRRNTNISKDHIQQNVFKI